MTLEKMLSDLRDTPEDVGGNGKGVFFGDMDADEYHDYILNEEQGWKGFMKKVFNLNNNESNNK